MKKSSKKIRQLNTILIVLVILLVISLIGVIGFSYYLNKDNIAGKYVSSVDITGEVISNAALWLDDMQDADITTNSVDEYMADIAVDITLELTPNTSKTGVYTVKVDEDSYNKAADMVYTAIATQLQDAILLSLDKVGYDLEENGTSLDELIDEALGMSAKDYIIDCKLDIIPAYSKLVDRWAATGNYSINDGKINLEGFKFKAPNIDDNASNIATEYKYIWENDILSLVENNMIFEKIN